MTSRSPMRRGQARRWPLMITAAVIVLPIAWYLASPLFINKTVSEAFPMSAGATIPEGMTRQQVEDIMARAARVKQEVTEAMPAGAPTALVHGTFGGVDAFHRGRGTASVYRVGQHLVLRLDPFEVTNGPNLYVYLSGDPAPRSSAQLVERGAAEVAPLKGNIGAQNYALPATLNLSQYQSVVIYCRMFHHVFSTAKLVAR